MDNRDSMQNMRLAIPSEQLLLERVKLYAELTDDFNPIHLDTAFAASTEFGRPIAHGTMIIAPLWDYLGEVCETAEVRFILPAPVGEAVEYWERSAAESARLFEVRSVNGHILATVRCEPTG